MTKMFELLTKLLYRPHTSIMLGRWGPKPPHSSKELISVFWANSDHCGGLECMDGQRNKDLLDPMVQNIKRQYDSRKTDEDAPGRGGR